MDDLDERDARERRRTLGPEPRLEEERRRRKGLSFRVNDEDNPETDVERRQKFGLWAAITAMAVLILGFYAFWRGIAAEAAGFLNTTVGWFAVVALLAGVTIAIVAVITFLSAHEFGEA